MDRARTEPHTMPERTTAQHRRARTLLALVLEEAPTSAARAGTTVGYDEALKEGPKEAIRYLAGVLWDGLVYGNWPTHRSN
jgi:hypothetical protein